MRKIIITQRVVVDETTKERRDCLDQSWSQLSRKISCLLYPLPNQIEFSELQALLLDESIAGIILSGGNDLCGLPGAENFAPERDRVERFLIGQSMLYSLPLLGVCRGAQILVDYFNGEIESISQHAASKHKVQFARELGWAEREVSSYHNFGIRKLPADFLSLGRAADGTQELFRHQEHNLWGMMWHPEREAEFDLSVLQEVFPSLRLSVDNLLEAMK